MSIASAMETESVSALGVGNKADAEMMQPIRQLLVKCLSKDSKGKVADLVSAIGSLSKFEKLLLYLELPSTRVPTDPLRQPINPLGSRSEIQLTITWIRTHFEEDPQVSLPKHEVYDEYLDYCTENSLKALSTADFGKVMKQVYPQVKPRRLGTRGNSRYCYAGLQKRVKLEEPVTPDCITKQSASEDFRSRGSKFDDVATIIVLEWIEKLLNEKVTNLKEVALLLIDKLYVDTRSPAARILLSATSHSIDQNGEERPDFSCNHLTQDSNAPLFDKLDGASTSPKRKRIDEENDHAAEKAALLSDFEKVTAQGDMKFSSLGWGTSGDRIGDDHDQPMLDQDEKNKDWEFGKRDENEEELNAYFVENSDEVANHDKLSQLRQLLEKNLKPSPSAGASGGGAAGASSSAFRPASQMDDKVHGGWMSGVVGLGVAPVSTAVSDVATSSLQSSAPVSASLCQRRRVSFNPLVVHESGSSVATTTASAVASFSTGNNLIVQPSPGTRKRHFSFQPISPRQASLPQSPNASPFISPRSTPVPMLRSRHSSGNALPLHLLPQMNQKAAFGSSSSDISRAATFGSMSECSTPFISPHGTPVPFNRSRHNSAQGRLCRSRHSSGMAPYRYSMTFSPMALNNLNNPYSPQPATPITNMDEHHMLAGLAQGMSMGPAAIAISQMSAQSSTVDVAGLTLSSVGVDEDEELAEAVARSRHNSAESEPPMGSMFSPLPMERGRDPTLFSGSDMSLARAVRQRHASAGHIQAVGNYVSVGLAVNPVSDMGPGVTEAWPNTHATSPDGVVGGTQQHDLMHGDATFFTGGGGGHMEDSGAKNDCIIADDDLDIALSVLSQN